MRKKFALVLKLITATAILLVFLCGYLTLQKPDYLKPEEIAQEVNKCGIRGMKILEEIRAQEQRHLKEMSDFRENISTLKSLIDIKSERIHRLLDKLPPCRETTEVSRRWKCKIKPHVKSVKWNAFDSTTTKLLQNGLSGIRLSHEYEVTPWESFTADHVYHVQDTLTTLPLEPLTKEYSDVIDFAVNNETRTRTNKDLVFVEGFSHCDRKRGIIYDVYIRESRQNHSRALRQMRLLRPFAPIQKLLNDEPTLTTNGDKWVNVIMPLKGKLAEFSKFLAMFYICCKNDNRIFLTIVYFGEKDAKEAENVLVTATKATNFQNYEFLVQNGSFPRERGLNYAVKHWDKGNVVMLFCDVDVVFKADFIERCRMNTSPGRRVYFPVVFSLYNPKVVYAGKKMPSTYQQLVAGVRTGFWRILGYGIACQYRDDFLNVSGMGSMGGHWGREGVELYRGYECLGLEMTRAFDRGVFHLYQERLCDAGVGDEEYRDCLETKAVYEVSHRQIGLLVFKSSVNKEREKTKLPKETADGLKIVNKTKR